MPRWADPKYWRAKREREVLYHRTFLPDGQFVKTCNSGCHGAGASTGDWQVVNGKPVYRPKPPAEDSSQIDVGRQVPIHGNISPELRELLLQRAGVSQSNANEPATQDEPPEPKPYYTSQQRIHAYRLVGRLHRLWIVEKLDQDFAHYATPWEANRSKLVSKVGGAFIPVVDEDLTVVGHYASANGGELLVPEDYDHASVYRLDKTLEADIPVFVALQSCRRNNDDGTTECTRTIPAGWTGFGPSQTTYNVLTGVDGEVIAEFGATDHDAVEPVDFWLADVAMAPKILIDLGIKAGTKFAKSLIRRRAAKAEARTVLKGPTKDLADSAAAKLTKREAADLVKSLKLTRGHDRRMGIPKKHFDAMVEAAKETDTILIFRANKQAAVELIEQGCPGKPFIFKFKTSDRTGVLTAATDAEIKLARDNGYFVVDVDGVARRTINGTVEELPLKDAFWKVEKGQVIDPDLGKPVVGDYDLLGVAPMKSKGSNLAEVPKDPVKGDWSGPYRDKAADTLNSKFKALGDKKDRILHGAQDQSKMGLTDDTAYAIFPDGNVHIMEGRAAQEKFWKAIGREPGTGNYNANITADTVVPADELAPRRGRK